MMRTSPLNLTNTPLFGQKRPVNSEWNSAWGNFWVDFAALRHHASGLQTATSKVLIALATSQSLHSRIEGDSTDLTIDRNKHIEEAKDKLERLRQELNTALDQLAGELEQVK